MKTLFSFLLTILLFSAGCNNPPDVQPTNNQISVYPNPTTDAFYIRITNPSNLPCTIQVFGTNGDSLLTDENNESEPAYSVDVSDKPKGTYEVIVKQGNVKTTQRIIKI